MKCLIGWVISIFGASVINAQCRSIPPNHNTFLFTNGITSLSHASGQEHKKMCGILLGLIVDLPVPGGWGAPHVVKAVYVLLDFLFLAQFQSHTSETLTQLEDCLAEFHNNKAVFVDLGIWKDFNIPKLHSLVLLLLELGLTGVFS